MNRLSDRNLQQSAVPVSTEGRLTGSAVRSLRLQRPAVLRVLQGQAWVTLGAGPQGLLGERAGDGFVPAGHSVRLPAGAHAVIEPVGAAPLHYRLQGEERAQPLLHWWQRAQMGPGGDELCCA